MRTIRFMLWLAVPATIMLGGLNAANAEVSEAVKQACTPDAMRLCSQYIPDPATTGACMRRHTGQLSAECRSAMHGGRATGRHGHRAARHGRRHHH